MKKITSWIKISFIPLVITLLCFNACTAIQFKSIPPPPQGSKLRVAILPISEAHPRAGWPIRTEVWTDLMFKLAGEHLRDTGIYEVVSPKEVNYAAGSEILPTDTNWWLKDDCALMKQYGKALYADYAMIILRRADPHRIEIKFINIETNMLYSSYDLLKLMGEDNIKTTFPSLYRKLFYEVKGDLLATAIRKGRLMPSDEMKILAAPEKDLASAPPSPPAILAKAPPPTSSADLSGVAKRNEFEKKLENELQNKAPIKDKTRLVVYDFNANEQLQVVSLILSDALREELFILGNFSLVNRENLIQVMQELRLQQSGLVDEKQVLKLGKWLAANEAVTGRFAQFGNSYILQAKRTDITTMNTLGLGSLKCTTGQEEELLAGLPELARKIAGLK